MKQFYLWRGIERDGITPGILHDSEFRFSCVTLEPPWKDNQRDISCVQDGDFIAEKYNSPKQGKVVWRLRDVQGRTDIEFHIGNKVSDTLGCPLLGSLFYMDEVLYSAKAFNRFMDFTALDDEIAIRVRHF